VADVAPPERADFPAGELQRCRAAGAETWSEDKTFLAGTARCAVRAPSRAWPVPPNTFLLLHSTFCLLRRAHATLAHRMGEGLGVRAVFNAFCILHSTF
jgi:hypothetical protein